MRIAFDLEGPLTTQDNAYELMKLIPQGDRLFEAISRYDDLVAVEGRPGYEPGYTLALILPFLAHHGIGEAEVAGLAQQAPIVGGARELVLGLKRNGWEVFCLSTSYRPFARRICWRVGIPLRNLACTTFPVRPTLPSLRPEEAALLAQAEREFPLLTQDQELIERLDRFFWQELSQTGWRRLVGGTRPVGGRRKVDALQRFAARIKAPLASFAVVGDSITDAALLHTVHQAGGLAIAFNANEYALPYATIGLASTHISDLEEALRAWAGAEREAVRQLAAEREPGGGQGNRGNLHWIAGRQDLSAIVEIHRRVRRLVRQQAARLG